MDKTTREYAEGLAFQTRDRNSGNGLLLGNHFVMGYLRAIEETNVKQLQEENERMREALGKIDTLLINDETNYDVWEIAYDALNNIK